MVEEFFASFFKQALQQGFSVMLLIAAIWFLNKSNQKASEATEKARAETDSERKLRIEDAFKRIEQNELDIKECERDRHDLRLQVVQLLSKTNGLSSGGHA